MKSEIELLKFTINDDRFTKFIEFVDKLKDSIAKVNTKYSINTFIQFDLERMREIETKLNS